MTLKKYREKRNFKASWEPVGKVSRTKKNLYVIHKHAARHEHYDLRLELNGVLLSWAVPKGPCLDPSTKRLAVHVEDHPVEYGRFEGTIPQGEYGGGAVMIWDKGLWFSEDKDPVSAYRNGNMKFRLEAKKLHGAWKLVRIKKTEKNWLLIKIKDKYSRPLKAYDITMKEPDSVVSGRSIDEIAKHNQTPLDKNKQKTISARALKSKKKRLDKQIKLKLKPAPFFQTLSPELATLVDTPPTGRDWLHEIKFDGYRLITFVKNNSIRLMTRNNNDWTKKFPGIIDELKSLPVQNAVFDGEVVVLDEDQRPNFQLLQNSLTETTGRPFVYYIFDLLYYDRYNLCNTPLIRRKQILQKILSIYDGSILRYSDHIKGSGKEVLKKSCELALEGIISKKSGSYYIQKRTHDWVKIKCSKSQEFIIGGFTTPKGNRSCFGALLLGTYNKRNELLYNGKVGTGFTESSLKDIHTLLNGLRTNRMPFKHTPPEFKKASWVKPLLTAEIEFADWTEDGLLRKPRFKGLRKDKSTREITKETATPVENIQSASRRIISKSNPPALKLTHPDKILYPEDKFTKRDIADYYQKIHKWILPYISNRPLTLVRCPEGYAHSFYQKHFNEKIPSALLGITIQDKRSKEKYIYIDDETGLMALPQLGVLEIHPWGSRVDDLDYPDMIIFDLDPAPELPWKKIVSAAFEIKKYLSEFKLRSFVKTTGGKGLHIVIPIKPEYDWNEVKIFSHTFARFMTMQHPDKYVNKTSISNRSGKIFVDYLRNQRGATAIAPYSTRARIHAPAATPLHWDELTSDIRDTFYNIKSLPVRLNNLKNDPWKDFFKVSQSLHLDKL